MKFLTPQQMAIVELLAELTDREFTVLILRFIGNKTQWDVGKNLNVTNERVRQIERKAISKLNEFIKTYPLTPSDSNKIPKEV